MSNPAPRRPARRRLLAALAAFALLVTACGELEPLTTEQALERLNIATTKLYAADGSLIANLHGEINRDIVRLGEVPEHVQNAVVAIEDRRFWAHRGIDLKSITRAFIQNVRNADDDDLQGGSTLSQQLVKNLYFPDPERTLARKISEARVTWQFEQRYSKEEILEMYLNTIYFGRGVYGIETAANSYFAKDADELTVDEAAYLAGLIHEPGRYDFREDDPPERIEERKDLGVARRNLVLRRMAREGFVSEAEAEEAGEAPLEIQPRGEQEWRYPYFVDMVLSRLGVLRCGRAPLDPEFDFLGTTCKERAENVHRGGLRIYTSLDPQAQQGAEEAIAQNVPPDEPRLFASLAAIEPDTGYVRALVGGKDYYPEGCEELRENGPSVDEATEELRRMALTGEDDPELRERLDQTLRCDFGKLNLALGEGGGGSGRQPGSSFKPLVLAEALKRGVSLYDRFGSAPFTHTYDRGLQRWSVRNYSGSGGGAMTLFEGTVNSVNAVYANLEIDGIGEGDVLRGSSRVADLARQLGIGFPTRQEFRDLARREVGPCREGTYGVGGCIAADDTPSLALGAKEVSPLEMASAYSTFANEGVRVEPTAVVRVTDGEGRTLYEADPDRRRVLPRDVALAVTDVLTEVVRRGTGTRAQIDRVAAGKTGTGQQWRDAWFDGYVPQLAAAVWVGNPAEQEEMTASNGYSLRIVGGSFPALIWQYFMTEALEGVPVEDFPPAPSEFFIRRATPAPQVAVPDVLGLELDEARLELRRAGFGTQETTCYAPSTAEGIVVKQTPAGGAETDRGATVEICGSVQALPSPGANSPSPDEDSSETQPGYAQVPNVVGESKADAEIRLKNAGFQTASVRECGPEGSRSANTVWRQDPDGGTTEETGSTVTFWHNPAVC